MTLRNHNDMHSSVDCKVSTDQPTWPPYWAALLSLFILLQALGIAFSVPRGVPPDEMAHIAYIRDAARSPLLLPDYARGEILDSGRRNYLEHPPLYYSFLGAVSRAAHLDPANAYTWLRAVSSCFVASGFLFWLLAFRNLGLTLFAATLGTLATCAVPMFGYAAAAINNDSLAYLGGALSFYGISKIRLRPDSTDFGGFLILGAGVAITLLSKATVTAFLFFFLATLCILNWRSARAAILRPAYLLTTTSVVIVCGAYFAYSLWKFGSIYPRPAQLYPEAIPANPIGLGEFITQFGKAMLERLPIIMSHASFAPIYEGMLSFFYAMFLIPLVAWLVARRGARSRGADHFSVAVTDAFAVALLATIAVNILITYKLYLHTGLFAGWQPRYLFFAIPAWWFAASVLRSSPGWNAVFSGSFALCAAVTFWSSSPFLLARQPTPQAAKAAASSPDVVVATRARGAGEEPIRHLAIAQSERRLAAHVDGLEVGRGRVRLRGWVFDTSTSKAPMRIWVLMDGNYLGSALVNKPRPDVAKALGQSSASSSGFNLVIEGISTEGKTACDLQLMAELPDSTLSEVRLGLCD